jgi:hypothetical protein
MTTDLIDPAQDAPQRSAVQAAMPQRQPRQLTVIQHAISTGATPAELREILALQVALDEHEFKMENAKDARAEVLRKRDAELAFRRDFAAFTGEGIVVPKSKFVDRGRAGSFYQAEFGQISTMLKAPLSKHGFGVRFNEVFGSRRIMLEGQENDIPWVYVTCYLEHRDGHAERLDLEGPPGDMSANTPTQNMQVTGSYLKRQALLAITGTATQDEDDESKLRNKRQQSQQGDDGAQQGPDESLLDAGRAAALNGMAALNKWWAGLTPRQQKDMGQDFGPMRKAARQADEGAQR